jgi:hypothetical protein
VLARHWGEQLQGARECRTMREANEYLTDSFVEMFPGTPVHEALLD